MSIVAIKYIQDMKTYSSTSILQRIINVSSSKAQKSRVNHVGDRIRINKNLVVMNHTSEKSKHETWS
jgi:hypothetical protein